MLAIIYELFRISVFLGLAGVAFIVVTNTIHLILKGIVVVPVFIIDCIAKIWEIFYDKNPSCVRR